MGDRISVQFANGDSISVALFNHWEGEEFLSAVKQYVKELKTKISEESYPIDRLEPETVMVDFIRWLTKDMDIVKSNLYLGRDGNDGDNSDNGNWVVNLQTGEFV